MINKSVKLLEKENLKVELNHKGKMTVKFGEKIATGGEGSGNYNDLINKPKINGNTLQGDQTLVALGLLNNLLAGTGIIINVEDGKIKISANGLAEVQFADIQGEPRDNEKLAELIYALEYAKLSKIDTGYHEKRLYAVDENGEQIMVAWSELPQGSGTPDNYCKSVEIGDNSITFRLVVDGTEIERVFNVNLDRYATIEYVDRAIATSTGKLVGNFPTYAELISYITADLHNNDYAIVLADETHENETWRYKWVVEGEQGEWRAEYKISSTPLTEEQLLALNSTITLTKVQLYDNHIHDSDIHLSNEDRQKLLEVDDKVSKRGDTMTGSLNMQDDDIVFKSTTGELPLGIRWFINDTEQASLYYDFNVGQLMVLLGSNILRFPNISGDKTLATIEEVEGQFIQIDGEDKGTGQLTQEQGEILLSSIRNYILLNGMYICKVNNYDANENIAYYIAFANEKYVSININIETGEYIVYIKDLQRKLIAGENITIVYNEDGDPTISASGGEGESNLIEKGSGLPTQDRPIGKLYEEDTYGALYQRVMKQAGIYDDHDEIIATWESLGINIDCSNAGEIISQYSEARIVRISSNVSNIVSNSFVGATQITKLLVPDSVENIAWYAFKGLYALEEISLPFAGDNKNATGVYHMFGVIFDNESGENVYANQQYYTYNNYIYTYTPKTLRKVIIRSSPSSVSIEQSRAFDGMNGIAEVVIANATLIEPRMFLNMRSLSLLTVYSQENTQFIFGVNALQNTNVSVLTLPKETTIIRNIESQITELHLLSTTPPSLGERIRMANLTYIGVPIGYGDLYRENENWSIYADIINEEDIFVVPFEDELKEWVLLPNHKQFKTINGQSIIGVGDVQLDYATMRYVDEQDQSVLETANRNIDEVRNAIPTRTSQLENDSGFLTEHQSLSAYRTSVDQDIIDNTKENITNKSSVMEQSDDKYPSCNAVINYIAQLNGDNDEF